MLSTLRTPDHIVLRPILILFSHLSQRIPSGTVLYSSTNVFRTEIQTGNYELEEKLTRHKEPMLITGPRILYCN